MRQNKVMLVVVVLVVALLAAYCCIYEVAVNEVAVHYHWGKVAAEWGDGLGGGEGQQEAGAWHLRWPPPIDTVEKFDARVRVMTVPAEQVQMNDQKTALVSMYAAWRIANARKFSQSLGGDMIEARRTLQQQLISEAQSVLARHSLTDFLNTDPEVRKLDEVEATIKATVQKNMSEDYGVQVVGFGFRQLNLPQEVIPSVFTRMKAEREQISARYVAEGDEARSELVREAQADAEEIKNRARLEAERIRSAARLKEVEFYKTLGQHKELAIFVRYIETMRAIARNSRDSDKPISYVMTDDGIFRFLLGVDEAWEGFAGALETPQAVELPASDSAGEGSE